MLLNVSARPRNGLTLQGGINTGRTVTDNCEVARAAAGSQLAQSLLQQCAGTHHAGHRHRLVHRPEDRRAVRRNDPQRSGRGPAGELERPNAAIAPTLGRNLSGNLPNASINLLAPGDAWGDRVNEIDLRIAKVLRFGRTRTNVGIDIFNLINSAAVLSRNQTFNPNVTTGSGRGWPRNRC